MIKSLPLLLVISFLSNSFTLRAQAIRTASATATNTPQNYTGRQIEVGSGGGFSGLTTTYYLLDNGKLFGRRSQDTTFTFIGQQTAANTKRAFTTVETNCKIKNTQFDHPGNIYKFVQWRKGKQAYKVTWGAADKTVPTNYPKFVNSFMAMIPASLRLN